MADLNPKIQIIMLTASRLNIQLKRDCEARNKKKRKRPTVHCLQEVDFKYKDIIRPKVKGLKGYTMQTVNMKKIW